MDHNTLSTCIVSHNLVVDLDLDNTTILQVDFTEERSENKGHFFWEAIIVVLTLNTVIYC